MHFLSVTSRVALACVLTALGVASFAGCSSGSAGSSSGSSSSYASRLTCTLGTRSCRCSSQYTSTEPPYTECSASALPAAVCCATSGFPGSGSCECKQPDATANGNECFSWQVSGNSGRSCGCVTAAPAATGTISGVRPEPSGTCAPAGGDCCQSADGCYCYPSGVKCLASQTKVTSCKGRLQCEASATEVTSCSGPAPSGSSSGGSSSSSGGGSSSSSSGSHGGCSSDSDCHDKCKRCVLSTGQCVSKLSC